MVQDMLGSLQMIVSRQCDLSQRLGSLSAQQNNLSTQQDFITAQQAALLGNQSDLTAELEDATQRLKELEEQSVVESSNPDQQTSLADASSAAPLPLFGPRHGLVNRIISRL